ncbi:ATP-binding protein [Deinococcus sonorensis]|uniref:histidine kinase n=2 Tax=Deinococcus sonorensis TaxID=309891 RepID=A0AAU7UF81_9DEIO
MAAVTDTVRGGWQALRRRMRSPSLAGSLLAVMLLVVAVTAGSLLFFANQVVQRQVNQLPPEIRVQFRPPDVDSSGINPAFTSQDGVLTGNLTGPGTLTGRLVASAQPDLRPIGPPAPVRRFVPRRYFDRARNFLHDVGQSLQGATLVSVAAGLVLALFLARRIARPISAVSEAAVKVAAGDLSTRAQVYPGDREVTELAQNFNAMARSLEVLEQERRNSVASIAHELRTPLTVMQARLDAIEDGIFPLTLEEVSQLSAQTQLLTRLVADLRTVSLAEVRQLALHKRELELLSLAESVARDLKAASLRGLDVQVSGEPARLLADPDRIRQVLVNLTENALKHARQQVSLSVQAGPRALLVHVDDDGPGIPEDERENVFGTFTRLETSRSRDTGGTGLGLSVVRALTQAHGGTVQLSGSPLGGTRATVTLPLVPA